ncbi:MAG TPA: portal protein, partial [Nitrosospira sp.]|nr:portal protein [Nitrosospira sp.]
MNRKTENLLKEARQEFAASQAGENEARDEFQEDVRFYEGEGIWDDQLRNSRINDPKGARPCLTVSDLPPRVRQVTNDVRQNKPAIKIRPVSSDASVETAEVFSGIFRHIEQRSMADIAYETANFYQ